jgi:hypothetical protein
VRGWQGGVRRGSIWCRLNINNDSMDQGGCQFVYEYSNGYLEAKASDEWRDVWLPGAWADLKCIRADETAEEDNAEARRTPRLAEAERRPTSFFFQTVKAAAAGADEDGMRNVCPLHEVLELYVFCGVLAADFA